ncbi:MAG: hypothetical protein ACR2N6_02160 [Miltoncostaeaceae bacterium]
MEEPDEVVAGSVSTVAATLGGRPGPELDRAALRDALSQDLNRRVGFMSAAVALDMVRPQGWSATAVPVDVAVRGRFAGQQSVVCACQWHRGDGDRFSSVVPALLAAVCASRDRGSYAYLVAGAPERIDSDERAIDLLDDAEMATLPMLAAGYESKGDVQATVPGRLRSFPVAEAWLDVEGRRWLINASRVEPAGGDVQVTL